MKRGISLIFLYSALFCSGLFGLDPVFEGVEILSGFQYVGSVEGEVPVPQVKVPLTVGFPVRMNDWWIFSPEMSLFWFPYAVSDDSGRPVPVEIERRNRIDVLHWVIDPQFRFEYRFLPELAGGLTVSPVFVFRIPGIAYDQGELSRQTMADYFYAKGRWFYPQTGFYLDWRPYQGAAVIFRSRFFYPLFHAWDQEELPFLDQFLFDFSIGIRFYLKGWDIIKKEPAELQEESAE